MTFAIAAKPMPLSGPPPVLTLLHYIKIIESLEIWNGTNYWFVGFDICKTIIRYVECEGLRITSVITSKQ